MLSTTIRRAAPALFLKTLRALRACALGILVIALPLAACADEGLKVGSKRFTESYVLGEILTQAARPVSRAEHKQGLGNTAIVFEALKAGSIDVYPEYIGTIDREILKHAAPAPIEDIRRELASLGLGVGVPLGFNNSYALAMRAADAERLNIRGLTDLVKHPHLRLGLSHEFLGRVDGWPGLAQRYALPHEAKGLDHGIAYEALTRSQVDVIDIYSTDAKINQLRLRVLNDDLHYFPRYDAVLLYRLDVEHRAPRAWAALQKLEGRIGESDMIAMNAAAELEGKSFSSIAQSFLSKGSAQGGAIGSAKGGAAATGQTGLLARLLDGNLWQLTRQHAALVALSVGLAALVGIPLGILAAFVPRLRQTVMAVVGVLQTVPSLALLAILIPVVGMIGVVPALIALFLYALLPIVRNTTTGLLQVPAGLRMAALALGLRPLDRLLYIELPLSLPFILAGIKTAAVMSVGTATIAAFIGAGGYGERIAIGLALNDNAMLLAGAIPAALFALLTQLLFEIGERMVLRRYGS